MSEKWQAVNPATEEKTAYEVTDINKLPGLFDRALEAQAKWRKKSTAERAEIISRFRSLLEKNAEDLSLTLTRDMGKPLQQSRNELAGVLRRIDFFLSRSGPLLQDRTVVEEKGLKEVISREPLGVIACISAWNYPYFVGLNVLVPALLTGNSVLYKPSEFVPGSALKINALFSQAGLPEGLLTTLIGEGVLGDRLLDLPVHGVFFTGSHATGVKIERKIAGRFLTSQFELGGKDPAYVTEDVDVKAAAAAVADGAFYNNGQSCCAVERIYVHEKIAAEFLENIRTEVEGFSLGDPEKDGVYLGPLARKAQLEVLRQQSEDALKKGARLLSKDHSLPGKGFYFSPRVFTDVSSEMDLMKEETFGPLIGIEVVKNDEEAVRKMNDTRYGLTAAVYSRNEKRMRPILEQMNTGTVYWNCCDRVSPFLPWSGRGDSGSGVTLSEEGITVLTRPKAWHLRQV